ncbi:MAG: threonine synthase, partial [Rhodothermales bacterium]|nr:threonine synthase [Rhodothermales bacterium]
VKLGPSNALYVLELYHGPTLSFKDFGARTLARLLSHFVAGEDRELTILVATSGDTGSAVADGFAGVEGIRVVLLYPENQVSAVQESQLIVTRPNVYPLRVRGRFDDCQRMVKDAFSDDALADVPLSTANSINIGRLLPQMLYYAWTQVRLDTSDLTFCVPSGNLGNLTAGMWAASTGMPCRGFIAAHNRNDFFPEFLSGSDASFRPSVQTPSNAMDVGAPSNFERLESMYTASELRERIRGSSVDDEATLARIATTAEEFDYLADPHTAVGLEAVSRLGGRLARPSGTHVILSTAHPAKFADTVRSATGRVVPVPERLGALDDMPKTFESIDARSESLTEYLRSLD